ncbi:MULTISPECIES: hypothetical protein [Haloferax]|uniref:Uncharacterized protein n=1 Tax=Haloferax massiliensis TaxID=1476858 RepID=A0A0D6JWD2_9EURY|nr:MULTISPECIES: hypothetical protein [Haloferax]MDS0242491.1 hypothetical protein [Haloferax sp. S2CR25]MDS0445612.1 hypothetical protein [Haloferax sp. S2CR25-2]CQR52923.1 hypothetical protein BN996_03369 [Haloferax massiliensis]
MPSPTTTRRRLLATGGTLLTAALGGCSQALSDSETGSRQLVFSLFPFDGSLRERYVVDLAETRPPWDEDAFNTTLNGTEYTTQSRRPFPARGDDTPTYARRNGTYYHLDALVVGEETVTHPVLRLFEVGRTDKLEHVPDHVAHSSLPEVDQQAVQVAFFAARARGNTGGVPNGLVQRDGYVYRDDDAAGASDLIGERGASHVEYRDIIYEVELTRETFHEAVYRADVDPVAESAAEIETILQAAVLDARVTREELSQAEREVLRQATAEPYRESHPYSTAFESLLKKLGHWVYLDGNVEKDADVDPDLERRFLRYDDRYFSYTLRFTTE